MSQTRGQAMTGWEELKREHYAIQYTTSTHTTLPSRLCLLQVSYEEEDIQYLGCCTFSCVWAIFDQRFAAAAGRSESSRWTAEFLQIRTSRSQYPTFDKTLSTVIDEAWLDGLIHSSSGKKVTLRRIHKICLKTFGSRQISTATS